MKYTHLLALAFALTALLSMPTLASESELKSVVFGSSLMPREARAFEYDKASQMSSHSEFRFEIEEPAVVQAGQIQVTGWLINSGPSLQSLFIIGPPATFVLKPQESAEVKFRAEAIRRQSKSPPMFVLDVPARTRVQFTGASELSALKYSGSPEMKLNWSFQFWMPPRPSGEVTFRLPTQDEANVPPFKIEIEKFNVGADVTEGTTAKVIASLRNVSDKPQIFCSKSPANFEWAVRDAKGERLANANTTKLELKTRALIDDDCKIIQPTKTLELSSASIVTSKTQMSFESQGLTVQKISAGAYQIRLIVLNAASGGSDDDKKLVQKLIEVSHASAATAKIEVTKPIELP